MIFLAANNRTSDVEDITVSFEGAYHAVLGLAELGKYAIMNGISDDDYGPSD